MKKLLIIIFTVGALGLFAVERPRLTLKSEQSNEFNLDSIVSENADGSYDYINKYSYDSKDNLIIDEYFINDSDTLEKYSKKVYSYDSKDNLIVYKCLDLDAATNKWENSFKDEYTYDVKNNQISYIYSTWEEDTWITSLKKVYSYNSRNNLILNEPFRWDEDKNVWKNSSKFEYTYDSKNNLILYKCLDLNAVTNKWEDSFKDEYTYDANNNQTSYIYSIWESDMNAWVNSSKFEYTYDSKNNQTSTLSCKWNITENKWVNFFKTENTYDSKNNLIKEEMYDWDKKNSIWILDKIVSYHYSPKSNSSINSDAKTSLQLSTTLVKNGFSVSGLSSEYAQLQIVDLSGKIVKTMTISEDDYVDVSMFPQGIYLVRVVSSNSVLEQKIVKQ